MKPTNTMLESYGEIEREMYSRMFLRETAPTIWPKLELVRMYSSLWMFGLCFCGSLPCACVYVLHGYHTAKLNASVLVEKNENFKVRLIPSLGVQCALSVLILHTRCICHHYIRYMLSTSQMRSCDVYDGIGAQCCCWLPAISLCFWYLL